MAGEDHRTCEVYWIHRISHTDIFSEGYVGISVKGAHRRFVEHRCAVKGGSTYPVHNAMRKYDDVIVETVLIGSPEYCQEFERKLRPIQAIGWNLAIGGGQTMLGYKMSDESKKKISENNGSRGRVYSTEERQQRRDAALLLNFKHTDFIINHLSTLAKGRIKEDDGRQLKDAVMKAALSNSLRNPWDNPNADMTTWLLSDVVFGHFCSSETQYKVSKLLNIPIRKLTAMYKRFKGGWNPGLCPEWQKFKNQSQN